MKRGLWIAGIVLCLSVTGCKKDTPSVEEQVNAAIAKAIEEGSLVVADKDNKDTSEDKSANKNEDNLVIAENDTLTSDTDDNEPNSKENESESEEDGSETFASGEAVLASTTLGSGFFANAKLAREQTRSKSKQALMDVIADETVSEEQKQDAIDCIIAMTTIAEMENAAELLLESKGFEGVVVNIVDGNVDVVVNAQSLTDAQIAQIEDIVMRKTSATADQIVITSVVAED